MKLRYVAPMAISLILCGCTSADWDNATSYVGFKSDDADAQPVASMPDTAPTAMSSATPQASADETFCKGFAKSEAWSAAQNGVGPDAQGRIAESAFRDCMAKSH